MNVTTSTAPFTPSVHPHRTQSTLQSSQSSPPQRQLRTGNLAEPPHPAYTDHPMPAQRVKRTRRPFSQHPMRPKTLPLMSPWYSPPTHPPQTSTRNLPKHVQHSPPSVHPMRRPSPASLHNTNRRLRTLIANFTGKKVRTIMQKPLPSIAHRGLQTHPFTLNIKGCKIEK